MIRRRALAAACSAAALLLAAGCATPPPPPAPPRTYVVLLPDDDGRVGQVTVSGRDGRDTRLDAAGSATVIGGDGTVFSVDEARLQREFGPALAARPKAPIRAVLHFEFGGTTLTPESRAALARIAEQVAQFSAPEVSVIGHTDRAGESRRNENLGLERARAVAQLLFGKVDAVRVVVESHGENNPLVQTADGVAEPRNRRVEVTVR